MYSEEQIREAVNKLMKDDLHTKINLTQFCELLLNYLRLEVKK